MAVPTNSVNMMVDGTDSAPNQKDLKAITTEFDSNSYPNWINLPPELLTNILKFLGIVDNICFGAVCTYWYSAAASSTDSPASQPPFLLLAGDKTGKSDIFQLFDLSIKKLYKIRIPQLRDRLCIGSSEGKLIYIDNRAELQVLDPITGSHFDLPSITTLPEIGDQPQLDAGGNLTGYLYKGCGHWDNDLTYYIDNLYFKVIICPRTSAIVLLLQYSDYVAFCHPGDRTWTIIRPEPFLDEPDISLHEDQRFVDAVFYKDGIHIITHLGEHFSLRIGDGYKLDRLSRVRIAPSEPNYLVEVGGELLVVNRYVDPRNANCDGHLKLERVTRTFRVCKVNGRKIIKSIGEYAMFLGINASFSLSTRDYTELKANSIYFTDALVTRVSLCPLLKRDLGVFNIKDGTIEPCYPNENDLHLNWPLPIWFTPKSAPCRRWTTET